MAAGYTGKMRLCLRTLFANSDQAGGADIGASPALGAFVLINV
jgi:hypothetical protein